MKRELVAEAGGATRNVVVETTNDGGIRVTVDGAVQAVDARRLGAGTWSILIDHRSYLVDLEPRRGSVAFSVGTGVGTLTLEDARARRLASAARRARPAVRGLRRRVG